MWYLLLGCASTSARSVATRHDDNEAQQIAVWVPGGVARRRTIGGPNIGLVIVGLVFAGIMSFAGLAAGTNDQGRDATSAWTFDLNTLASSTIKRGIGVVLWAS